MGPLFIVHIHSHTGLLGPLTEGNEDVDWLLTASALTAQDHNLTHLNARGLL